MMQACYLLLAMAALSTGTRDMIMVENSLKKSVNSCLKDATLLCRITTQENDFSSFYWLSQSGIKLCEEPGIKILEEGRIQCHYNPKGYLNLTILNLNETDMGLYICRLKAKSGHDTKTTTLNITVCPPPIFQPQNFSRKPNNATVSRAECRTLIFLLTVIFFILQ